ncbi:helix-turn-helix domain-containing protein [Ferrimicrobium acidiphilum]|uniref:helix-turn-helix domain-containing protein n=1 Tax=Ferrimicrobium acidiphilum TaxID=121039 RepID=UPI0009E30A7C
MREPNSPRSSDNSPQARVRRAKIALLVDEGMETNAIAKTLSLSAQTVDKRRRRFSLCGVGPD